MRRTKSRRLFLQAAMSVAYAVALVIGPTHAASAQTMVRYSEVIRSIFYLPSYVALEKGYFAEQGLEIDLSTAWGSERAIPLLLAGKVDVALLGPESALYIQNSPSPLKAKMFCALTAKDGQILMSREKIAPDAFRWDMIKGKVFLDWRHGTTPQLFGEWTLKKHGLDLERDLTYITNVATPTRAGAWVGGKGDFGTFFEPTASLFEREGKAYPVVSIGAETGLVDYTVYIATDKYIAENPKTVQSWCNAIHKAQKFVVDAEPAGIASLVAKYFPKLDHDLIVSSIERYRQLGIWKTSPITEASAIEKMQDVMVAGGVLKSEDRVPYEKIVLRNFAETAIKTVP